MRRVLSLVAVVALAWPSPATAGSWVWPLPAPHAVVRAFDSVQQQAKDVCHTPMSL